MYFYTSITANVAKTINHIYYISILVNTSKLLLYKGVALLHLLLGMISPSDSGTVAASNNGYSSPSYILSACSSMSSACKYNKLTHVLQYVLGIVICLCESGNTYLCTGAGYMCHANFEKSTHVVRGVASSISSKTHLATQLSGTNVTMFFSGIGTPLKYPTMQG